MKPVNPPPKAARKSCSLTKEHYPSIRLNGQKLHIGDVLKIKECKDEECFGTLLDILKPSRSKYQRIKIRWFYKPSDLFVINHSFLSSGELFDSDHVQEIWFSCVYDKIQVISLEEYNTLEEVDDDIYFTRATYIKKAQKLVPSFEEWKKVCICSSILNPDHLYNVCEKCGGFFHPNCLDFAALIECCPKCHK